MLIVLFYKVFYWVNVINAYFCKRWKTMSICHILHDYNSVIEIRLIIKGLFDCCRKSVNLCTLYTHLLLFD